MRVDDDITLLWTDDKFVHCFSYLIYSLSKCSVAGAISVACLSHLSVTELEVLACIIM